METPPLPQIGDFAEIAQARARGADVQSGYELRELTTGESHDVGGVLLPRPFKITKIGPMAIFVGDVDASEAFYRDVLGFTVTESVTWEGQRCAFMRHGNEHHSIKLFPRALRSRLGLSEHTSCASMGMQVGSYRQLRDAVAWLKARGARFIDMPAELSPGIDYVAHVQDPEGHCLQLFYYMEQVGWDGRPRPASDRRPVQNPWPEALDPLSDTYVDQVFQGPLG
jgi:catechol 2,3-dioxygenase-like lactoylglutathione lyase family enzyme